MARLPLAASNATTTIHGVKTALELLITSTPKNVVKGCLRAAEHFREAWLARAQSASSGHAPLTLASVEELLKNNRLETGHQRTAPTRVVGSYQSELDILQSMINLHPGNVRVKFIPSPDSPCVDVLPVGNAASDNVLSVVIANPDGFQDAEIIVRKHWMDQEARYQEPNFVWNNFTNPQTRTVQARQTIANIVEEVTSLERRSRYYCKEREVFRQIKRVQRASSSSGAQPPTLNNAAEPAPAVNGDQAQTADRTSQ